MRTILVVALMFIFSTSAWAGNQQVWRLLGGNDWYLGQTPAAGMSALDRGYSEQTDEATYLIEGFSGQSYTFGLKYEADINRKVQVSLYDRWPEDTAAREYPLPMGSVLQSRSGRVFYRWSFDVSPKSPSGKIFIVVKSSSYGPNYGRQYSRFRHLVALNTPALKSQNLFGRGVTYRQGPTHLMLSPEKLGLSSVYALAPASGSWLPERKNRFHSSSRNLVRNGDFSQGLRYWDNLSDNAAQNSGISVSPTGLRLKSDGQTFRSGITQRIYADVGIPSALVLRVDLRIDREDGKQKICGAEAPVIISICYEDQKKQAHCGAESFRRAWTTEAADRHCPTRLSVRKHRRIRFSENLMHLNPAPSIIRTISIEGTGLSARDAQVQKIHLIRQGGR